MRSAVTGGKLADFCVTSRQCLRVIRRVDIGSVPEGGGFALNGFCFPNLVQRQKNS